VRRRARQIFLVVLTIGLYFPYFVLIERQLNGRLLCRDLHIQVGAFRPLIFSRAVDLH
jgi:hypothetical protein